MATGDAVSQIYSVAAGATVTFQPAAGVEVCVTWILAGSYAYAYLTDGTNNAQIVYAGTFDGRVFITNARYLAFYNSGTSAIICAFSGVQTKG